MTSREVFVAGNAISDFSVADNDVIYHDFAPAVTHSAVCQSDADVLRRYLLSLFVGFLDAYRSISPDVASAVVAGGNLFQEQVFGLCKDESSRVAAKGSASCGGQLVDARLEVRLFVFGRVSQYAVLVGTGIEVLQLGIARVVLARDGIVPTSAVVLRYGETDVAKELMALRVVVFQPDRLVDLVLEDAFRSLEIVLYLRVAAFCLGLHSVEPFPNQRVFFGSEESFVASRLAFQSETNRGKFRFAGFFAESHKLINLVAQAG